MNDSHNDDPFAPPDPHRFEQPAHESPLEHRPPVPTTPPVDDAASMTRGPADPVMASETLHPSDPVLPSDPAPVPVSSANERMALDGTSLWLNRLGEELVAWLKTLASAAVYATLIVTFGFQVARVEGMSMAPTLQDQDR